MSDTDWQPLLNQAKALMVAEKPEAVEALLRQALAGGGPSPLWRLLALALRRQGKLAESLEMLRQLVDSSPSDLETRFDLAETLLLLGDFDRGWREYRFRYRLEHTRQYERKVQQPRWNGRPMPSSTLLIHDEQGYGDSLQFLRLVPEARRQSGARVVLEVMPEVLPLARRMVLGPGQILRAQGGGRQAFVHIPVKGQNGLLGRFRPHFRGPLLEPGRVQGGQGIANAHEPA